MSDARTAVELVNPASQAVPLLAANVSYEMGERAAAVPAGVDWAELDWADRGDHQIEITKRWTSPASEQGVGQPSVVRFGCVWTFGARLNGHGRYLADAYLYTVVDTVGLGQSFSCTGWFAPSASEVGNGVALLGAAAQLDWEQFGIPEASYGFTLWIQGDGAGWIEES